MTSHRYTTSESTREPHLVSLKVLRLSRSSLAYQHPVDAAISTHDGQRERSLPASLAYASSETDFNPDPFLIAPILNLPPSFASAYVGENFSCTLCANNEVPTSSAEVNGADVDIRDVRIDAEMTTPNASRPIKLDLTSASSSQDSAAPSSPTQHNPIDLAPGETCQEIVNFSLKEEGTHVLGVTVSYYEASATSGRTRTFRKLYQFVCKSSLVVRTKATALPDRASFNKQSQTQAKTVVRRWALEAQLENVGESTILLENVAPSLEPGLVARDCNWRMVVGQRGEGAEKPVLRPGEVEQVCFIIATKAEDQAGKLGPEERERVAVGSDGKVLFGALGISWRSEMGKMGYITTGKLGARVAR